MGILNLILLYVHKIQAFKLCTITAVFAKMWKSSVIVHKTDLYMMCIVNKGRTIAG